jgi:arginyl-tRNA synthetase
MNVRLFLSKQVKCAMNAAGLPADCKPLITPGTRPEYGDYQSNGALPAAKKLKANPREVARQIIDHLMLEGVFDKVEIAGPGFINFHFSACWLAEQCSDALNDDHSGVDRRDTPETVVVDYSGPNLAKEMHVGHLRSTIIGDSVVRVLELVGDKVIRQNHMGDWGTQFGMLIAELEETLTNNDDVALELADLESFYQRAKLHFDADPVFAEKARSNVVKLQSGDDHCLKLWQQFIDVSIAHSEIIYRRLNATLGREHIYPESKYNDDLPQVVADLKAQKLAVKDQGAEVVFLDEFADKDGKPSPVIVQKSDGGYLYATSDLAALRYRNDKLRADRILYFVDARQALHLQQVFSISRKAGFVDDRIKLEHLAFGTMMGQDGKPFKTRTGGTVKLAHLLDEAIERAQQLVLSKNHQMTEEESLEIARKVGIGAVKYADLSKNRTSDYIFNWDSMLSFEGNTAPYLQYAYTRIRSIFRKAGISRQSIALKEIQIQVANERALALKLIQFSETVEQVARDCGPNLLCTYLYELASETMRFYEMCPILKDEVLPELRDSRLQLCRLAEMILEKGLGLLGIEVMEKM